MSASARKFLIACVATGILVSATAILCELVFRLLLFSSVSFMEQFRNPGLYADTFSDDDWWKLYYRFRRLPNDTAKYLHPLLGWSGEFLGEAYQHAEAQQVGARRPVLLYGDSFTQCVTAAEDCFQGILNTDTEFSKAHYLLNYGTSGYGIDQIYLLLKHSLPLYDQALVIVGIHTRDLDRSILSFFVGHKPYFDVVSDELVLRGTPIEQDPRMYHSENPPHIWSYLYRLWLYQDGRPVKLKLYLRGTEGKQARKVSVNTMLVREMLRELKERPVLFVIFAAKNEISRVSWREQFLTEQFARHGVPFISNRTIIAEDMRMTNTSLGAYYLPDGHPSAYQNRLVAIEMKRHLHQAKAP